MDDESIAWMQKEKRLKLDTDGLFSHYIPVALLCFLPGLYLYDLGKVFLHTYDGSDSVLVLCLESFLLMLLPIGVYVIQSRALRFIEIKIKTTDTEFKDALSRTAKQLEWEINEESGLFTRAYKRGGAWEGYKDDMITIIRTETDILVNSITLPGARPSVTSTALNRKNAKVFYQNLKDVIGNVDEIKKGDEKPQNEWTALKILSRVVLYPLCIALMATSFFLLIPSSIKGAVLGLSISALAAVYLYTDISMIFRRRIKKSAE